MKLNQLTQHGRAEALTLLKEHEGLVTQRPEYTIDNGSGKRKHNRRENRRTLQATLTYIILKIENRQTRA